MVVSNDVNRVVGYFGKSNFYPHLFLFSVRYVGCRLLLCIWGCSLKVSSCGLWTGLYVSASWRSQVLDRDSDSFQSLFKQCYVCFNTVYRAFSATYASSCRSTMFSTSIADVHGFQSPREFFFQLHTSSTVVFECAILN